MSHSEALSAAMRAKGMTKKNGELDRVALAATSGVHETLIGRYLRGKVTIGAKNARPLADALGVSFESLLYPETAKTEAA